jgi:VanZ family protein
LFVSGRAGRVQDVLIDSAGALVGIVVVFVCLKFKMNYNCHKM